MVLYVDGGCSGNEQRDIGRREMVSVVTDAHGRVLSETTERGGSNNIAELIAVRDALRWCLANGVREVTVRTDSRNNRSWIYGRGVGKKANDRDRVLALRAEIAGLRAGMLFELVWVPREQNKAGHHIEATCGL